MRIDHSEAEILHHQQTFTKFLAAVDSKKLAMAQVLRSPGKSFDDLIQTMERLKLEVNNSRRAAEEKESKLSGEREAKMESLIEEYQAAEEEIEELKSLLQESKLANEETGEEVSKAIAEEKELKGSLESRYKQQEEMKRLQTISYKLAVNEAAILSWQELASPDLLTSLKVQLMEEQEKERKVKENLDRLQLREEKEKEEPNHSISEPSKDDIKPLEVAEEEYDEEVVNKMRQEVRQAREMVRRATRHKEMLRELYEERNKNNKHADKSFAELRGEYIR